MLFLGIKGMIFLDKLLVDLNLNSYYIYFSDSFSELADSIKNTVQSKKVLIVTDSNVNKLYCDEIENILSENGFRVSRFVFDAGEEHKNMEAICDICKSCVENKLDRNSVIIALGGGVAGDMAGFASAIYMRGIDFIQIPTTLLSQSDSSVGGKTGVDFCGGKNILGAFHQPKLVYINTNVLKTLPEREFISGMGEVIKHALIADEKFFEYLFNNYEEIKSLDNEILLKMCRINCSIKANVVSKDEKEAGLRAILNFGHTIGHAIESYFNFELSHGECVGLGICGVFYISEKRGLVASKTLQRVVAILKKYGFKTKVEIKDTDKIIEMMYMDKKARDGILKFILPCSIGKTIQVKDVEKKEIIDALNFINIGKGK